jgi:hypothetical protein
VICFFPGTSLGGYQFGCSFDIMQGLAIGSENEPNVLQL